ncbi:MAG: VWA domain-containing protein [Burkholderiaceae bacterium]
MSAFNEKFARLCGGVAVAALLGVAAPAQADRIQLGFILDGSGSIGAGGWQTIVTGLSNAIDLIPVGGPDQYEVSVVTFSTSASTPVARYLLTDVASRDTLSDMIAAIPFLTGNTNYAAAFDTMTNVLQSTIGLADATYVNFATDGQPNTGGTGVLQRDAMIAAGVDNISIEGIGSGVSAASLQNNFCYPGPCDTTIPFSDFPSKGFYIGVGNPDEYAQAIQYKVRVVTGQVVPEPESIALLGIGLIGLVPWLRRRTGKA